MMRSIVGTIGLCIMVTESLIPREWVGKGVLKLKSLHLGFPGGAVVENLPADAGDTGSSPGKSPHAMEQLGP